MARTSAKVRAARIARLFFLRPIKFSIDGVVVGVPVVDAKAPSCFAEDDTDLFASAARLFFLIRPTKFLICDPLRQRMLQY